MKITQLTDKIWKFSGDSNIYFLNFNTKILIDAGNAIDKLSYKKEISKVINLDKIKMIIFTHLHYDHIGNVDLFKNAKFYASKEAIEDYNKNPFGTILNSEILEEFSQIKLCPVTDFEGLKIISTPGHSRGSISIWYEKEKILFTGDTVFDNCYGRIDLPTSVPEKMDKSIEKLNNYKHEILAPGHDY
jgi:hydroxyacylglutathione hydrolase